MKFCAYVLIVVNKFTSLNKKKYWKTSKKKKHNENIMNTFNFILFTLIINSLVKTLYWYDVIFFFLSSLKSQSQIWLNLAQIINGEQYKKISMTTGNCWYFRYVELEIQVEINLTNPPVVRRDLQYNLTTLQKRLSFLYHGYQHQYTTQNQDWQVLLLSQWQKMKV